MDQKNFLKSSNDNLKSINIDNENINVYVDFSIVISSYGETLQTKKIRKFNKDTNSTFFEYEEFLI